MIYDGVISIFFFLWLQRGVDHYLTPVPHRDHYWAMTLIFFFFFSPENYTSSIALQYTRPPRWCNHVNVQQGEQKLPFHFLSEYDEPPNWFVQLWENIGRKFSICFSWKWIVGISSVCCISVVSIKRGTERAIRLQRAAATEFQKEQVEKRQTAGFLIFQKRYTTKFTCCWLSAHFQ